MRIGQARIDGQRPALDLDGALGQFAQAEERALQRVGPAERCPGERVLRVVPYRGLERCNRALDRIAAGQPEVHHPPGEAFVRLDGPCLAPFDLRDFRSAQHQVEALAQLVDDLVLQGEDLRHAPVDLDGAPHGAGRDIQEVRRDADGLPHLLKTAHHHPCRAETAADVDGK